MTTPARKLARDRAKALKLHQARNSRLARELAGVTQTELGDLIGTGQDFVSRCEQSTEPERYRDRGRWRSCGSCCRTTAQRWWSASSSSTATTTARAWRR